MLMAGSPISKKYYSNVQTLLFIVVSALSFTKLVQVTLIDLEVSTGGKQTSWLLPSMTEEVKVGLP